MLLIVTNNGDEILKMSTSMTLNDLKPFKIRLFSDFLAA